MRVLGPTKEGTTLDASGGAFSISHTANVRYLVLDVFGDSRTRVLRAESAAEIPRLGSAYPGLESENCLALAYRSRPINDDGTAVEVVVRFETVPLGSFTTGGDEDEPSETSPTTLTISGASVDVETNKDLDGVVQTVSYTPPGATTADVQPVLVTVRKRLVRYQFTRVERLAPDALIEVYTGTVNADTVGRHPAGWLFCDQISSTQLDDGTGYRTQYDFVRQVNGGFDPSAYYVDARTSRPPADLVEGVGIKEIRSYPRTSFSALRLPWPS